MPAACYALCVHRLTLIGYRACGKSTVGRLVAARLGFPFIDADAAVEVDLGMPIRQYFAEHGEAAFRDAESKTLERLLTSNRALILATGGGAVLRETNRSLMQANGGVIVYLHAPVEVLQARLCRSSGRRPSLTGASVTDEVPVLLAQREPLYRSLAATVLDATAPTNVVADQLCALMLAAPGNRSADHV